jgi:DNA processing protein
VLPESRGWPPGFGRGTVEREALLILSHLETLTPRRLRDLAWTEGSARGCVQAVRSGASSPGDRDISLQVEIASVREAMSACTARVIGPWDREYPPSLVDLADPPACLFVRGQELARSGPAVAVVGARSCSAYGREVAMMLGRGLGGAGVTVVSGAARGVDAAAHRGALSVGGPTVAVLGSGIDVAYPSGNRGLIDEIATIGTVVSEYPPGLRAASRRFPARNRLIAGLSRAVTVVEGAVGSGSLITAEFAVDLGRDVFAVPGPVTSPLSAAPHELLKDGALLARGPGDVLEGLGVAPAAGGSAGGSMLDGLSSEERRVLEGVIGEPVTAEAVAGHAALPISAAVSVLMSLEVRGLLRSVGGRYQRTAGGPPAHL